MRILEHLTAVDSAVVLAYLAMTVVLGLAFRRQSTATEFLLANRGMGWLPVGLSVMATLFSANSFLMIPGEAGRFNLLIGMALPGIFLAAPLVMRWFIPIYVRSGCFTAYELLERRFDVRLRLLAAALFIFLRLGWMAAATFACSLAVAVISGTDLTLTIAVMGLVTTLYTVTGGMKAVMWNDVAQFVVFTVAIVGGAMVAIGGVPGGWAGTWEAYDAAGKFLVADWRLDFSLRLGSWALVIGAFVENLSAYATDQSIVQRYLSATSEKTCRLGFLVNIAGVSIVMVGLLVLGAALSGFYQAHPERLAPAPAEYFARRPFDLQKVPGLAAELAARQGLTPADWLRQVSADRNRLENELLARYRQRPELARQDLDHANRQDEVLPLFVRREMPRGLAGLVIAALLAATMSSISGGIHSIATSLITDVQKRLFPGLSPATSRDEVRVLRALTLVLGLAATGLACVVERLGPVFDMNKKLNGTFSGPLLGMFLLAFFSRRAKATPVLLGALIGAGATFSLTYLGELRRFPTWISSTGTISPFWFCVIGFLLSWSLGYAGSLIAGSRSAPRLADD